MTCIPTNSEPTPPNSFCIKPEQSPSVFPLTSAAPGSRTAQAGTTQTAQHPPRLFNTYIHICISLSPLVAFDILVQTLKLFWTWQVTSWSPFIDGSWLMGSPPKILTSGLLPYDLIAKLNLSPSWKEPWSSFPRLWGGGYLSSPRPGNGSLRHLRTCRQLLEFLDSTSNPLSQRNWPMVSWVRNS